MVIEMFRKNRSKSNVNSTSKESLNDYQGSSSNDIIDDPKSNIIDSTVSLYRSREFELWYIGKIQDVNLGGVHERDLEVLVIDKVEEAQLEGKIELLPREEDLRIISISKYGLQMRDLMSKKVLQRHPLHTMAQIVYYADSFNKNNLALRIGQVGRSVFDCLIFQCYSENQAQDICQSLKDVFDLVSSHRH